MKVIATLASSISLLIAYPAFAQSQCSDLFRPPSQSSTSLGFKIQKALANGKQIFFLKETLDEVHLTLKVGSEKIDLGALSKLPPLTEAYHWGSQQEHAQLTQDGSLNQTSIINRISGRDRAGGGFYVSLSPIDSASFGTHLTVSVFQTTVLEIPRSMYGKILALSELDNMSMENMDSVAKARKALNVSFSQANIGSIEITPTWKTLLHESSLTQLRTPTTEQALAAVQRLAPPTPQVINLFLEHNVPPYMQPVQDWVKTLSTP